MSTWTLDIETESWDRFVVGGMLDSKGYREFWDRDRWFDALLPGEYVGLNSGKFDSICVAEIAVERGLQIRTLESGSRLLVLEIPDRKIKIVDSWGMIPCSAKDGFSIIGESKTETGLPCVCGDECGGYCSILVEGMPIRHKRRLSEYLENDVHRLSQLYDFVKQLYFDEGWEWGYTQGSSAARTAAKKYGVPEAEWFDTRDYHYAASAAFGGRVQVFRRNAPVGVSLDLVNAYGAAMTEVDLPYGPYSWVSPRQADLTKPGIYTVEVEVSDSTWIPPLPVRLKGRNYYPTGRFRGTWTSIEIRAALAAGATLHKIYCGIEWPKAAKWGADYFRDVDRVRRRVGPQTVLGKKLLNRQACVGVGKYWEKPTRSKLVHVPDGQPDFCPAPDCSGCVRSRRSGPCCKHRCTGSCRGCKATINPRFFLKPEYRLSKFSHVQWAAFVTSSVRAGKLLPRMQENQDRLLYSDTDCTKLAGVKIPDYCATELGSWDYEHHFSDFKAVAPKLYAYLAYSNRDKHKNQLPWPRVEWTTKSKGIDISASEFDAYVSGKTTSVDNRGVWGLRTAIRKGGRLFRRKRIERSHHKTDFAGDRIWRGDTTFPLSFSQCRERAMEKR